MVPAADRLLMQRQRSAPLSTLLKRMNKDSDNFFAEILLKGLGKDFAGFGTSDAGVEVARATLRTIGLPVAALVMHDGSGLSYEDRVTPTFLVQLLTAHDAPAGGRRLLRLARHRRRGRHPRRPHARHAAARQRARQDRHAQHRRLVSRGTCSSANDRSVGYSILVNGDPVDWTRATKAQDAIVVAARRRQAAGQPAPEPGADRLRTTAASVAGR